RLESVGELEDQCARHQPASLPQRQAAARVRAPRAGVGPRRRLVKDRQRQLLRRLSGDADGQLTAGRALPFATRAARGHHQTAIRCVISCCRRVSLKRYIALACLLLWPQAVAAQSNTGSLRGVVTDKVGAAVAGARLQLTNAITRYTQTAVSDSQGAYRLLDVPLNEYTLAVEAPGFETVTRDIHVRSNLTQQVDVQLGVEGVRQEVNVQAARGLLDAEKTAPS